MNYNCNTPYNDLPELPPKEEIETKAILKMAIRANKAIRALSKPALVEKIVNF